MDNIEDFIRDDYEAEVAAQRDAAMDTELIAQHHTAINKALEIGRRGSTSTVKLTLLKGLSLMKGAEIRVADDQPSSALNSVISDMLPPADHEHWGDKPKPKSQLVNMRRMAEAGLVEALWSPEGHIIGFRLIAGGMAYLHRGGWATLADVVDMVRGLLPDETTNRWFRKANQMTPVPGPENDWRYKTHANPDMPALVRADRRSLVGAHHYQGKTAVEIGAVLKAVIRKDGGECLRHLREDDREALMYDLLAEAGIDNRAVAKDLVEALNVGKFANRIAKVAEYHKTANVSWADDALNYINEEVCRYTWALVRNHVDFRVNDLRSIPRARRRDRRVTTKDLLEFQAMHGVKSLVDNAQEFQRQLLGPTIRVTRAGDIKVNHPDDR